ncbi:hypothetical protein V8E51_012612 [Hyaloscypha variabilis]
MAPFNVVHPRNPPHKRDELYPHGRASFSWSNVILEGWSQGVLCGGLLILILFTVANMKRHVLLHKLILLELVLALGHGTFIFFPDPVYGWYLSCTATLLYISFFVHNIVSWMKIKRFLPPWGSKLFIGTIFLALPYWISETYFNFEYFNNLGDNSFVLTRPWEAPMRDGWWVFTTCRLIYIIKNTYNISLIKLIRESPRFGVLIMSMLLSIAFVFIDIAFTVHQLSNDDGVNPFWKFYVIFKCASDVIFLDDFKKVIDSLLAISMGRLHISVNHGRNRRTNAWPIQFSTRSRASQYQTPGTPNRESHFSRLFNSRRGHAMEQGLSPALPSPLPYASPKSSSSHGGFAFELENAAPRTPVSATAGQDLLEMRNEHDSMA